jgi:nucleotide-binding universal stress UspA family protein
VCAAPMPAVVVGVDGSAASAAALVWAAAEARGHHVPLVVAHVLDPRSRRAVYAPTGPGRSDEVEVTLTRIKKLTESATAATVEQVFEIGVPAQVLVRLARGARLLVLGHGAEHHLPEGREYQQGPALGSIARACIARAECPVVVVPATTVARIAVSEEQLEHHAAVTGARAVYPFQGRIPVAHH